MTAYSSHFSTSTTPQAEQARGDQAKNNEGGFVFSLDKWGRLDRFLILGAEGGTYYASEKKLIIENAKCVMECVKEDGFRAVERIVEISDKGRAPKNDPAIFALAIASGVEDPRVRSFALDAMPKVCRIGTHLFKYLEDVQAFRRWGRGLKRVVARWYNERTADQVAFQAVKYGQRGGWSHRDVLRKAHVEPISKEHEAAFRWIVGGMEALAAPRSRSAPASTSDSYRRVGVRSAAGPTMKVSGKPIDVSLLPSIIGGFEALKAAENEKEVVRLVRAHKLPHETVDGKWKGSAKVWEALLPEMGQTALLRNLGKMTSTGLFGPMGEMTKLAAKMIADKDALKRGRVHPMAILIAQGVYAQGHGDKGSLSWTPAREILDALDEAFYLAFDAVEPTGKNHFLALDVSQSMTWNPIAGTTITPRVASAAMAMVTARVEKNFFLGGFTSGHGGYGRSGLTPIDVKVGERLDALCRRVNGMPAGGTDCSLPVRYALERKIPVDCFVVYTDNETYAGPVHAFQVLKEYRQKMGRPAKLIVVGMTATEFTIADPRDAGMFDVVGFDSAAPALMADFARG
jgi:60 kDa SS-A/Ro ribonucleoprotein